MMAISATDLDADIVELAPWAPPADQTPLREMAFRVNAWRPEEIDQLRAGFAADMSIADIAASVGRTFEATRTRIWEIGLRRNSALPWSEIEDAELVRRYGSEPAARIAGDLGRSATAVYSRAQAFGLSQERPPAYDPWEDEQIRAGYAAGIPVAQIAALMGRPLAGLMTRASILRLRHPSLPEDWSVAEASRMLELAETGMLYSRIRRQMVAEGFPPRSKQGFGGKLRKLGYGRGWGRPWTADEDNLVRRAYANGDSLTPLISGLGRTRTAICWRAKVIGIGGTHVKTAGFRQGPVWSEADNQRLREAYGKVPMQELADELGRKLRAMYVHAHQLGLSANYNRRFTEDEDRQLREAIVAGTDLRELARPLDRNVDALQRRAKRLGLKAQ